MKHKNKKVVFYKYAIYKKRMHPEKQRRLHLVLLGILFAGIGVFSAMEGGAGEMFQGSVLMGEKEEKTCKGVEMPIELTTQGMFVPDEIVAEFTYAPEAMEVEYFRGGETWRVQNITEEKGKIAVRMTPVGEEVERKFGTVRATVNGDSVVQVYLKEILGGDMIEMRNAERIKVDECN